MNSRCRSSRAARLADMSSRTAAWGQPPVSIARIRLAGRALCLVRNSASSRVKISLVTAAMEKASRKAWQSASMSAVLPDPTGLEKGQLQLFTVRYYLKPGGFKGE